MRREQAIRGMRLRLLALVLALALFWYAVSPAPGTGRAVKTTEEPPDDERCDAEIAAATGYGLDLSRASIAPPHTPPSSVGEGSKLGDLEWPEVIDL